MKTLHVPERCEVLLEPDADGGVWVSAVRYRGMTWYTRVTLKVWWYWGDWWLDPQLAGEARTYYVLGTSKGEISVFHRINPQESERGWFVEGWYD
jgi:hypothetical protein